MVCHKSEYGDLNAPFSERHVQAVWYDCELRPSRLVAEDGREVRVVYPGDWNDGAGPDFRNAVLEVGSDRERLSGDVEVHLAPSDWDAHGHGVDPRYGNVIAHVTWRDGRPADTLPSGTMSICLGRFVTTRQEELAATVDVGAYPFSRNPSAGTPCRRRIGSDRQLSADVLVSAGSWRLQGKANRLADRLRGQDVRQVFYSEVMGALGYGKNAEPFRRIATAVPYAVVVAEPSVVRSAYRVAASFACLCHDRTRPCNSPEVRLDAAARLFTETDVMSLADVTDVSPKACRAMLRVLADGGHVGRGRSAAIIANVVLPLAIARGRVSRVPDWLPPEDLCRDVRNVAFRMFGRDHNPQAWYAGNGLMIQGLIQIGREHCSRFHPECVGCPTLTAA